MNRLTYHDLKPRTQYRAFSPTGIPIQGTADVVPGSTLAKSFVLAPDGEVEPAYASHTEVYCEGQCVYRVDGQPMFQDTDGAIWKQTDLQFEELPELVRKNLNSTK